MLFVIWYRPPSAPAIVFTDQLDKIIASATKTYKKVCILDDFNMYIGVTVLHLKNRAQHIFVIIMLNVYGLVQSILSLLPNIVIFLT